MRQKDHEFKTTLDYFESLRLERGKERRCRGREEMRERKRLIPRIT
jgi:hypothetical protein